MAVSKDEERYVMESNDGELQRLANQHAVLKSSMGTVYLAPLDFSQPNLRILDSATADGLWLRDLHHIAGSRHTYIGTDIVSSFFPKNAPLEMTFEIQSITQDWPADWESSFDYVHQRLALAGAGHTPLHECVTRLIKLVKQGGWIELFEAVFSRESENGPAIQQFEHLMKRFLEIVGVGFEYARPMKRWVSDAGLLNIQEKVFLVPYGAACQDSVVAKQSVELIIAATIGLRDFAKGQKDIELTEQELEQLPSRVKRELEENGATFRFVGVWAQKPVL